MKNSKIKILIVDDSITIQKLLSNFLGQQPDFEIVGICSDPFEASEFITDNKVDCMILDLELPKMDGVTFLKKIVAGTSIQTIILSGLIKSDPNLRPKLISIGALDAFAKPEGNSVDFFNVLNNAIRISFTKNVIEVNHRLNNSRRVDEILLVASSTGGTDGVRKIIQCLGPNPPTVIIIQHMAALFTKKFAASLNLVAQYDVEEINDHSVVEPHKAYIAPGNFHVNVLKKADNTYWFELNQDQHIHAVRPAADYTFLNFPKQLMKKTTVVVLSGMGRDGALGLAHLKKGGAKTIAESEKSAVVFGMPKAAIETGGVDLVLTVDEICDHLAGRFADKKSSAS